LVGCGKIFHSTASLGILGGSVEKDVKYVAKFACGSRFFFVSSIFMRNLIDGSRPLKEGRYRFGAKSILIW